jgi:hypothetical protein
VPQNASKHRTRGEDGGRAGAEHIDGAQRGALVGEDDFLGHGDERGVGRAVLLLDAAEGARGGETKRKGPAARRDDCRVAEARGGAHHLEALERDNLLGGVDCDAVAVAELAFRKDRKKGEMVVYTRYSCFIRPGSDSDKEGSQQGASSQNSMVGIRARRLGRRPRGAVVAGAAWYLIITRNALAAPFDRRNVARVLRILRVQRVAGEHHRLIPIPVKVGTGAVIGGGVVVDAVNDGRVGGPKRTHEVIRLAGVAVVRVTARSGEIEGLAGVGASAIAVLAHFEIRILRKCALAI